MLKVIFVQNQKELCSLALLSVFLSICLIYQILASVRALSELQPEKDRCLPTALQFYAS